MEKIIGRLVTVEQTEEKVTEGSFFKVSSNTTGKEWEMSPDGANQTPSRYWDTLVEDEAKELVKRLYKTLSKS